MLTDNAQEQSQAASGKDFERFTLAFYRFEFPRLASYLDAAKTERQQGVIGSRGKAKDFICRTAEQELSRADDIESREIVLARIESQLDEIKALLEKGVVLSRPESQEFYPENTKLSTALSALGY